MGRLIDADVLVDVMDKHTNYDDTLDDDITCILEEVPTAYDVEAKVAELENFEMWKELLIYDLSHREREIIEKAISIVRGKE